MNQDGLQSIWKKSGQQEPKMDQVTIERILESSARSGWWGVRVNVWAFLAMLVVSEVFHIMNVAASVHDFGWLAVHAGLAVVTLGFIVFGLRVLRELRTFDDPAMSLTAIVKRQLQFFQTTFEWWGWMWGFTVWMVSFCIVVWVENREGGYRINHIAEYVAVSACMIFGSYALLRLGHYPMVRRSLATLHDLESQTTEETRSVQSLRKYWVIGTVLLVVALTVAVAWTFHIWLAVAP